MKVTIESVRERIAQMEAAGELSIKEQFYLEAMRMLVAQQPHHNGMMHLSHELAQRDVQIAALEDKLRIMQYQINRRDSYIEKLEKKIHDANALRAELAAQDPAAWSWKSHPNKSRLTRTKPESWKNPRELKPLFDRASPPVPFVLKGGSLKEDGHFWYKAETVAEIIRAGGGEVVE